MRSSMTHHPQVMRTPSVVLGWLANASPRSTWSWSIRRRRGSNSPWIGMGKENAPWRSARGPHCGIVLALTRYPSAGCSHVIRQRQAATQSAVFDEPNADGGADRADVHAHAGVWKRLLRRAELTW